METLLNLGLALALGLLVGVERGWQERETAEGRRLAPPLPGRSLDVC
jgi:hypothetical protein